MTTDELENTYINLILTDPNIGFKGFMGCNKMEVEEYVMVVEEYASKLTNYMFKRDELKKKLNEKLYSIYKLDITVRWDDIRRNLLLQEIRDLKLKEIL